MNFKQQKMFAWHFADSPPPPLECHVLFEWPLRKEVGRPEGFVYVLSPIISYLLNIRYSLPRSMLGMGRHCFRAVSNAYGRYNVYLCLLFKALVIIAIFCLRYCYTMISKGSSIKDVTHIYIIFDTPPPSSHFLLLRPYYCRNKTPKPQNPKTPDYHIMWKWDSNKENRSRLLNRLIQSWRENRALSLENKMTITTTSTIWSPILFTVAFHYLKTVLLLLYQCSSVFSGN